MTGWSKALPLTYLSFTHYRKCAHRVQVGQTQLVECPRRRHTVIQLCFLFSRRPLCSPFAPLIWVKFLPRERWPGCSGCYVYWRGCHTRSDSFTDFHSLKNIEYKSSFIGNDYQTVGYLLPVMPLPKFESLHWQCI